MYSIIYSADIEFQIISLVKGNSDKAWIIANEMFRSGKLKANKINHYDVMNFKNINDMNVWILKQVQLSRN